MSHPVPRRRRLVQAAVAALAVVLLVPAAASALTVSKAELRGGQLRVEGSGTFSTVGVTASSSTSTASARADQQGRFKIEATGFSSSDCTVVVSDDFTPIAIATLSGCTPVAPTPVGVNPPPTGACVIDAPAAPTSFNVGDQSTQSFTTTGCQGPVQWSLVAGTIPSGMQVPTAQDATTGEISGLPVAEGTYEFTVRATDATGAIDQETFTDTVLPPRELTIANSQILPPGAVNQGYFVPLRGEGGLPGYLWAVVGGALPPGIRIADNELTGVPTQAGTFSFTLQVTDSRGTSTEEPMTLSVSP